MSDEDPLEDSHVSVVIPGLLGLVNAVRRIQVTGERVDLSSVGGPELALEDVRYVEFALDRGGSGRGYTVKLATREGAVPVLESPDRVTARALAERTARRLRRSLRDLTGEEVRIRKAEELDRPLELEAPPAGLPEPSWKLAIEEGRGRLEIEWSSPNLRWGLGLALGGLILLGFARTRISLLLVVAGAAMLLKRSRLTLEDGRIRAGLGIGPLRRSAEIPVEELEQVELEAGDEHRLVLVSDNEVLELVRPRQQLEWIRRRLLEVLRGWRDSPPRS